MDDREFSQPNKMRKLLDKIPARLVLYFLSWSGFLVSFVMRNDINFAIVEMVKNPASGSPKLNENITMGNGTDSPEYDPADDNKFDWSNSVQSFIVSSFYFFYVVSQVVGGIATQKFGTKSVFGWSQFATGACSLLIPLAASTHYSLLILLRSIQGFASGLTWPAMYAIVGYWIPPSERSRFMSSFQGFSIGIGLTYPLCGFILDKFTWPMVFYVTGTIGISWCVLWYFLAFNTPAKHPRISKEELHYIQSNVSEEIKAGEGMKVPWISIFKSLPAWSIGVTTFGRIWVHYTFIIFGPQYMKYMLEFDIKNNGLLNGLPFLLSYLSSVVFCYIADVLVERNVMSLTNVRKMFTASSQILPGIMVVAIGYLGKDIVPVLVLWFIAVSLITAAYAGAMATIVDIAPNLAGPVLAFAQTIHMSASFLQPIITEQIIVVKTSESQWMYAFYLTCGISIVTYLMYQVFGTSQIQSWNYPPKRLLQTDDIRRDETPEDVDYNTRLKQQFINI